ncbi:hypothetical protein BDW60DRAFT_199970 [Aspergillus nidulans var. acristatus]
MVAIMAGHSTNIALVQPLPCLVLEELAIQAPLHSGLLLLDGGAHVLRWRHAGCWNGCRNSLGHGR